MHQLETCLVNLWEPIVSVADYSCLIGYRNSSHAIKMLPSGFLMQFLHDPIELYFILIAFLFWIMNYFCPAYVLFIPPCFSASECNSNREHTPCHCISNPGLYEDVSALAMWSSYGSHFSSFWYTPNGDNPRFRLMYLFGLMHKKLIAALAAQENVCSLWPNHLTRELHLSRAIPSWLPQTLHEWSSNRETISNVMWAVDGRVLFTLSQAVLNLLKARRLQLRSLFFLLKSYFNGKKGLIKSTISQIENQHVFLTHTDWLLVIGIMRIKLLFSFILESP